MIVPGDDGESKRGLYRGCHGRASNTEYIVFVGTWRRRGGGRRGCRVGHGGRSRRGHVQCPGGVKVEVEGEMVWVPACGGVEGEEVEVVDVLVGLSGVGGSGLEGGHGASVSAGASRAWEGDRGASACWGWSSRGGSELVWRCARRGRHAASR